MKEILLDEKLTIEDFVKISRNCVKIGFSDAYRQRVRHARKMVEDAVEKGRVIYGTTTGFGQLSGTVIPEEKAELLQKNIILTHSVSVGAPLSDEVVRGTILMVLLSMGKGVSGIRLEVLEYYRKFLNEGLLPVVPGEGSVGYLCPEAHIAAALLGVGRVKYKGKEYEAQEGLMLLQLQPIKLRYKEGLCLTSGESAAAALAALAVYDLQQAAKTADIIAAMSLEGLHGLIRAYDSHVSGQRRQSELTETMQNVRRILSGSTLLDSEGKHLQDPLSLRCIPQLHGAAKHIIYDAYGVVERELDSCCDNPILFEENGETEVYSNGNPDSAYLGISMDSACIAAANLAKMSERRSARFMNQNLSGYPWFLAGDPGLNSGLMILQYTQAGLLNEIRVLSTPASIDSVPTSADQEDYVAMGYNACRKAAQIAEKLEWILALELMAAYQATQFQSEESRHGVGIAAVVNLLKETIPLIKEDQYLYPLTVKLKECIHSGEIVETVEKEIGMLL